MILSEMTGSQLTKDDWVRREGVSLLSGRDRPARKKSNSYRLVKKGAQAFGRKRWLNAKGGRWQKIPVRLLGAPWGEKNWANPGLCSKHCVGREGGKLGIKDKGDFLQARSSSLRGTWTGLRLWRKSVTVQKNHSGWTKEWGEKGCFDRAQFPFWLRNTEKRD